MKKVLAFKGPNKAFKAFLAELRKQDDKFCTHCIGTGHQEGYVIIDGEREFDVWMCVHCHGTGRVVSM